ncbi:MAG: RNA polymerase sigma factor [Planctomycetota bacterium]
MDSFREDTLAVEQYPVGSKRAFEVIVRRYMKDAYFIALGLVGNRDDAMDLSQEAFARAYRNLKHFNKDGHFFPWFYRILRNVCFSHLRKRRNERQHLVTDHDGEGIADYPGDDFTPEVVAERNETKDRLWAAIGRLDEKHREVIILRHFRNLSYEQIAETLMCNKGTVTSRLYYARKKLKEILEREKGGRFV